MTRTTHFFFLQREKEVGSRLDLQSTDSRMAKASRLSCWWSKVNDDKRASKCIHLNVKIIFIYFLFLLCQTKMA